MYAVMHWRVNFLSPFFDIAKFGLPLVKVLPYNHAL